MPKVYKREPVAPTKWARRQNWLLDGMERYKVFATWTGVLISTVAIVTSILVAVRATTADQKSQEAAIDAFGTQIELVMNDWDETCRKGRPSGLHSQRPDQMSSSFKELERIGREIRVERVGAQSLRAFMKLRLIATRLVEMHDNYRDEWKKFLDQEKTGIAPQCVFVSVHHGLFSEEIRGILAQARSQ